MLYTGCFSVFKSDLLIPKKTVSINAAFLLLTVAAMKCWYKRKELLFRNYCTVSYHLSVLYFVKKKDLYKRTMTQTCHSLCLLLEKPFCLFWVCFSCVSMPCVSHDTEGGGSRWRVQRVAERRPPATLSQADKNLCCPGCV